MKSVGAWFKRYLLQFIVLAIVIASMYALNPRFHVETSIERLIPLGVIAAGLAVTMIAMWKNGSDYETFPQSKHPVPVTKSKKSSKRAA